MDVIISDSKRWSKDKMDVIISDSKRWSKDKMDVIISDSQEVVQGQDGCNN